MTVGPQEQRVARRPQLSDEAATYVRAQIMSGKLKPGDAVRVDTIAEALSISTTPAREALKALRVEGFLELIPRKGFQVAHLSAADIQDLFTVQALVAGELVARAVKNATDEDRARLHRIHQWLVQAAEANDIAELEEQNHQFHRELNRLGDSPKILWVLGLLTRYVPRMYYASIPGWPESTMTDHHAILAAFDSGDAEAGRAAMKAHLTRSGELLAANFDRRVGGREPGASQTEPD